MHYIYSQARIIRANIRIYIANMDFHRLHKILCLAETETVVEMATALKYPPPHPKF